MSVPRCAEDCLIVQLSSKFKDQTKSGIYIDTTYNPGEHATVTGKVLSVPRQMSNNPQKIGIAMEVEPGDELAFSYRVVYNQAFSSNDQDRFYEEPLANPYITKWSTPGGLQMVRRYLGNGKFDAAIFREAKGKGEILDKTNGPADHVHTFVTKYLNQVSVNINYKNRFVHKGDEFWKVDYQMAYVVKRGDDLKMIGGHVLLECPKGGIYRGKKLDTTLEVFEAKQDLAEERLTSRIVAIGTPLAGRPALKVQQGDEVVINRHTAQEYTFWDVNYIVVRQDQLLAKTS